VDIPLNGLLSAKRFQKGQKIGKRTEGVCRYERGMKEGKNGRRTGRGKNPDGLIITLEEKPTLLERVNEGFFSAMGKVRGKKKSFR